MTLAAGSPDEIARIESALDTKWIPCRPSRRIGRRAIVLAIGLMGSVAGCGGLADSRAAAGRDLTLSDFVRASSGPGDGGESGEAQIQEFYGDLPSMMPEEADFAGDDPIEVAPNEGPATKPIPERASGGSTETSGAPKGAPQPATPDERATATARPPAAGTPSAAAATADNGTVPATQERWIIDGLLGQINGRPIFADEFLAPLEATLQIYAAMPDRAQGRRGITALINDRFQSFVDSELIISEAESQLTPEQQQGLFAWLRTIQESEIAERGGTRASAAESLEDDLGMSIDEFLQQRRDRALAATIVNKRVEPRTIVSSRDVEREYRRRYAEFNPLPVIQIGRLRVTSSDQAKLAKARELFAGGTPFLDVVAAVGRADDGLWFAAEQNAGMSVEQAIAEDKNLASAIKTRLRGLAVGQPSEPSDANGVTTWFAIIDVKQKPVRSLYDADVQLELKGQLKQRRSSIEQMRYLTKLRSRWISDDIEVIEQRLVQVALARYWKP